jgi:hypothetical protein
MKTLSQREVERQKADDAPFKFAQDLKANVDDYLKSNPQVRVDAKVANAALSITAAGKEMAVEMKGEGSISIVVCGVVVTDLSHDQALDGISRFLIYCHSASMTAPAAIG